MIIFKHGQLNKKEKKIIESITGECSDLFGDAYITKNNLRLFLRENVGLLFEGLSKGDKIAYEEDRGFVFICGYSDNAPRKYIKILTKDEDSTNRLVKTLQWHVKEDLFCKIKKNNPIKRVLERNGFRWAGDRGKECLLCRKYIPSRQIAQKEKAKENEQ